MENQIEVENKTNSNAIISLVLGILSIIIPFVGFIIGIVGIVLSLKAKKVIKVTNEAGKGFATGGLICSIVGILLQIISIAIIIFFFFIIAADINNYSTY